MNQIVNLNQFLVKEHVGMFRASNNYDIYDLHTGGLLMNCREENLGFFTRIFRFSDYKTMTPFEITVKSPEGSKILTVKRGFAPFLSKVQVFDGDDRLVGKFKQKLFSLGGKFDVMDPDGNILCSLKGKWTGWDFRFTREGLDFAHVSKKWAGFGKELFTSADNYVLAIDEKVPQNNSLRLLILGAVLCIDMVLKE